MSVITEGAARAGREISDRFRKALPGLPDSCASTLAEIIEKELDISRMLGERDALRKALLSIMIYRQHDDGCQVSMTEFCTCGMKEAADAARLILNRTVKP